MSETSSGSPRARRWRVVALFFLGSFLIQIAWILAVPPFRGIDEFDHVYRAAAVAHGQWIADYKAPQQRGNLVTVPRSIVEAARPECYTYYYTTYNECNPVRNVGNGYVTVASSAARYNPVYYWVIGTPAKPFQGTASLFVMRFVASLISSAMIAGSAWVIALWSRSTWPLFALVIALTPEVMYTSMLPAPNSVEMLGGLGVWAALLGMTRVREDPVRERILLWAAVVFAIPLALVRSLGPLWLAMIAVSMLLYFGWARFGGIVRRNPRTWSLGIAIVAAASAGGGLWSLLAAPNAPANMGVGDYSHPLLNSSIQTYVWIFQSFAAFPTRGDIPSLWIFAIGLNIFAILVLVCLRLANRRLRFLMAATMFAGLAVPFLITLSTYRELGGVWQGRYTLPYCLGVPIMAGLVLEKRAASWRMVRPTVIVVLALYWCTHVGGILYVLDKERQKSPLAGTSAWWIPSPLLVAVLILGGISAWAIACLSGSRRSDETGSRDRSAGRNETWKESLSHATPTMAAGGDGSLLRLHMARPRPNTLGSVPASRTFDSFL